MSLTETFGRNVRRIRLEKKLTIEGLATDVGLSYSYMANSSAASEIPPWMSWSGLPKPWALKP